MTATNRWAALGAGLLALTASGAVMLGFGRRHADASGASAEASLRQIAILGAQPGAELFRVKSAAFLDSDLVVVTGAYPAVHLFQGGVHRSWGREGQGPAEFASPEDVVVRDGQILVRDGTLEKIVAFDRAGRHVATRTLQPHVVNRLSAGERQEPVLGLSAHRAATRAVARLGRERLDTLVRYTMPASLHLSAPGSPSLTLPPPYTPQPRWTVLTDGRVAFWDGRAGAIALLGGAAESFPLPRTRFAVGRAEQDEWLNREIPQTFMGRPLFEPLRARARQTVVFPDSLPPVLDLTPDPAGGVWVRQTTAATGERWTWVGPGQVGRSFRLPAGARLLAVGRVRLAVLTTDADDVESVRLYEKPASRSD